MVLSRREHTILFVAIAIFSLLLVDMFVIKPIGRQRQQTRLRKETLSVQVDTMRDLLDRRRALESRWQRLLDNGLTADRSLTESTMWHALHEWSSECGFNLPNVTPQVSTTAQGVPEIIFTVSGRGSMQSLTQLLWRIEQAPMPVRIRSVQLGSTGSSGREITLTMRLSVLYLNPDRSLVRRETL